MLLRFCQSLVTLLGASDVFFCFQFPRSRDSESRRRPKACVIETFRKHPKPNKFVCSKFILQVMHNLHPFCRNSMISWNSSNTFRAKIIVTSLPRDISSIAQKNNIIKNVYGFTIKINLFRYNYVRDSEMEGVATKLLYRATFSKFILRRFVISLFEALLSDQIKNWAQKYHETV